MSAGGKINFLLKVQKSILVKNYQITFSRKSFLVENRQKCFVSNPKIMEENQNYRKAFEARNTATPIAIRSGHGIVELQSFLLQN